MSSELLPVWAETGTSVPPDSTKRSVGWTLGEKPPYEYMNWWMKEVSLRVNTILREGPAPWSATTTYQVNALVSRNGIIYRALAINANSAPPSANWLTVTQNATALTSGTVDRARLPTTLNPSTFQGTAATGLTVERTGSAINAVQEFRTSAGSVFAGMAALDLFVVGPSEALSAGGNRRLTVNTQNGNISWSGVASGVGSGITGLDAGNLGSGTVPPARISGSYSMAGLSLSGDLTLSGGNVEGFGRALAIPGGPSTDPSYGFSGVGAGAGLHMLAPGTRLDLNFASAPRLTVTASAVSVANGAVFTGSGSGLTNLPAASLTGTIANARLSGSYSFDNLTLSGQVTAATGQISRIEGASGSADSPTLGFLGTPGLGIFRTGSSVGFSAAGIRTGYIGSTGMTLNVGNYTGDGSGLTDLNATRLTTGTVPDERLPAVQSPKNFRGQVGVVVHRNDNTINSTMEFRTTSGSIFIGQGNAGLFQVGASSGLSAGGADAFSVAVGNGDISWRGAASGNGSGITGLNASALASGSVPNARMSGSYSFDGLSLAATLSVTGLATFVGGLRLPSGSADSPSAFFSSSAGTGIYRPNADVFGISAGGLGRLHVSPTAVSVQSGASFTGSGSGLTELNASRLDAGTLPVERMSTSAAARDWVGARTSDLAPNAIGSYTYAWRNSGFEYGDTVAGSSLNPGGVVQSSGAADLRRDSGVALPGTWRACGYSSSGSNGHSSLFRRIA